MRVRRLFGSPEAPPNVRAGDHASYLARARWALEQAGDLNLARLDIATATALAPNAWEPWVLRAKLSHDDLAVQMHCLDEALARGADVQVRERRAWLRAWTGQYAGAEEDYGVALEAEPAHQSLLLRRAEARAQQGRFAEALEDLRPCPGAYEMHERRVSRGTLHWIVGDFAAAYREFTSPIALHAYIAFFNVWSHLCQVAHGAAGPLVESVWAAPSAAEHTTPLRRIASGGNVPPEHDQGQWPLLLRMFEHRIAASDVLAALSDELQVSDAWRPPASPRGASLTSFMPPRGVWRGELQFYVGMWHLSRHEVDQAAAALAAAASCPWPASMERLAAAAQLRRLDRAPGAAAPRQGLVRSKPSPSGALHDFLAAGPTPSDRTPGVLKLNAETLFDDGLRLLLQSPRLRAVEQLELRTNGLTAAGMEAFRDCPHLGGLTHLDLSENRLGDAGVQALLQGTMPSLRVLKIAGVDLSDEGAEFLLEQPLALSTLMLGDTPIDLSIWRRLARRYGEGLFARGAIHRPYDPPFDRSKVVDFVSQAPAIGPDDPYGERRETSGAVLQFCVADCVALRLCSLSRLDVFSRYPLPHRVERSLHDMEEEERRCAAWPDPYRVNDSDSLGFTLLTQGVEPLELHCVQCGTSHRPPFNALWSLSRDEVVCPAGHLLHRWTVLR